MPEIIHVKVKDGDIYCNPDPHRMSHQREKWIEWHSNKIDFDIKFLNGSPFISGNTFLRSMNKKTDAEEVQHPGANGSNAFVYEVIEQNPAGEQKKVDPGLIIEP